MEVQILAKKDNPLLQRTEVSFRAIHKAEPTPTRDAIRQELAKHLKAAKDVVVVDGARSTFGRSETSGYAKVYKSKEQALSVERYHILVRNKLAEPRGKEAKPGGAGGRQRRRQRRRRSTRRSLTGRRRRSPRRRRPSRRRSIRPNTRPRGRRRRSPRRRRWSLGRRRASDGREEGREGLRRPQADVLQDRGGPDRADAGVLSEVRSRRVPRPAPGPDVVRAVRVHGIREEVMRREAAQKALIPRGVSAAEGL